MRVITKLVPPDKDGNLPIVTGETVIYIGDVPHKLVIETSDKKEKGKYVKGSNFNRLTNMRCKAKDLNKRFKYRNNWCINDGDCGGCHVAKYYEEYLKDKSQ